MLTFDLRLIFLIISYLRLTYQSDKNAVAADKLLLITVATEETDGYKRFIRSAEKFDINVKVLGLNQKWKGGDMNYPGGGHKIIFLREALQDLVKTEPHTVVLFTDSYDVIINGPANTILDRFRKNNASVLFSAEKFCWPDGSLAVKYPVVKSGKRYLNSGMFIGYLDHVFKIASHNPKIEYTDDDQLYYTKIYLDEDLRKQFDIKLDHICTLFQNLNGVTDEVSIFMTDPENDGFPSLRNLAYSTSPLIVHGNGPTKTFLNYLGRYIGKSWKTGLGCVDCMGIAETYRDMKSIDLPVITLALFVERPTPFLARFFEKIVMLQYPKSKMHLFLYNKESFHNEVVNDFVKSYSKEYISKNFIKSAEIVSERIARDKAIEFAIQTNSEFLFVVDSNVRLTNKYVIERLMDRNKPIIAPMVSKPAKLYSNFWGDLSTDGFYSRSEDYIDIVEYAIKGTWNVPYISSTYLIRMDKLKLLQNPYSFDKLYDPDMSFAKYCLDKGHFMFVDNLETYGYLVVDDDYNIKLKNPDFYQLFDNTFQWEQDYLHENYTRVIQKSTKLRQPCPDVYWFPVFTDKFCKHMIEIMENYGKWSTGTNQDERLAGGYENVPTRDIHMNQVGLERHWLHMLDKYFRPIQEKLYQGYFHVPPHAIMNFVVRYRPDEQPYLKPHHDASTYTVNLALNRNGIDYEGGGSNFIRYNCSVVKCRTGWAIMHPGRLTHYHEGLPTVSGTRYIMVSFVDP